MNNIIVKNYPVNFKICSIYFLDKIGNRQILQKSINQTKNVSCRKYE